MLLSLLLAAPAAAAEPGWQKIGVQEGISLYVQPDSSRSVPVFKGVREIEAPLYQLLAILADIPRVGEWNSRVAKAHLVQHVSELDFRFYVRIRAPWPASDRDVVLQSALQQDPPGDHVDALFRGVPDGRVPPAQGVVRFPRLHGTYRLDRLGPNRTRVEYKIDADPGGMIPGWLISHSVRAMPVDALAGLNRQARKTRGLYDDFIRRHDPRARDAPAAAEAGGL